MPNSARRLGIHALAVTLALAALSAACNSILGTGYATEGGDGVVTPLVEAGVRDDDAQVAAPDACATAPTTKSGLEASLCGGQQCMPVDRGSLLASGYCAVGADGLTCTVPSFDGGVVGTPTTPSTATPPSAATDGGSGLPGCSTIGVALTDGGTAPVIYATGSTAIAQYMATLGQLYAQFGIGTLLYSGQGSCVGVTAAYAPPGSALPTLESLNITTFSYYDAKGDANGNPVSHSCVLDVPGQTADIGVSDVYPQTCDASITNYPLPAPYADFFGPVQVMEMVVPNTSHADRISYEQAQLVWGYGGAANVSPWTDTSFLLRRSASSGTQAMIAKAIGLDSRLWVGVANASSSGVLSGLFNVKATGLPDGGQGVEGAADKALGILGADVADGARQAGNVRPLAFQDRGQSCAFLPDSTTSSFDKQNVRDGHYPIWGPIHLMTTVGSTGIPYKAAVSRLIAAFNGLDRQIASKFDVIALYAKNHVIPTCAMHVARSRSNGVDGSDYEPYAPAMACSCYYDSLVSPGAECTRHRCATNADCASNPRGATVCNAFGVPPVGYCEMPGDK